jgi:hypothetical protein
VRSITDAGPLISFATSIAEREHILRYHAALAALILVTHTASAKDPALLSLSLEHFRDSASVHDDPASGSTTISTQPGYVEHWGLLGMVWHDEFLKSVIDDKAGQKSFEIDAEITYSGAWRSYETANYQGMTGPKTVKATLVRKETANCNTGECMYTEHLAIPIEEDLLRHVAASYAPGKAALWTYKLVAKRGGPDYHGEFSNAEFAGLLARVDGYTPAPPVAAPAPPAAKAAAPAAPVPLDFGISGLAVSPAETPSRAGVLVVGVNNGSVAQKAGIIVGDIIYKFDARPIRSLPELQAAAAASVPHSRAIINIYRGTDQVAVTAAF